MSVQFNLKQKICLKCRFDYSLISRRLTYVGGKVDLSLVVRDGEEREPRQRTLEQMYYIIMFSYIIIQSLHLLLSSLPLQPELVVCLLLVMMRQILIIQHIVLCTTLHCTILFSLLNCIVLYHTLLYIHMYYIDCIVL